MSVAISWHGPIKRNIYRPSVTFWSVFLYPVTYIYMAVYGHYVVLTINYSHKSYVTML